MLGRPTSPDFVGRGAELAALRSALERASGGEASAVFLCGESGVGKSRLFDEFASRAQQAGATVMVGACGEFGEEGPPYWPVVDALRSLLMKLDAVAVEDVLGPFRPELTRLLPELGTAPGVSPEEASVTTYAAQDRLFDLVLRVLHRLGERTPVVLAVEDLHWADRSTRALVSFLLANLRQARALLVVTYRSDALVEGHFLNELMAEVHRARRAAVLELPRFTRDELEAQLAGILGMAPRPEVVDTIWARSEGNAFFAEELLPAVLEGRGDELPPSLRPILLARLEGLPEAALEVLRALTVGGLTVGQPLLAAVTPLDDAERMRALRACVAHHLIVPDHAGNAYRFRHSLLREALYGELLPDERAHYHAAYGRALDERPEIANGRSAAERAYHWHAAGDFPRALLAAVDAGLAAERLYGFAEAQRHYERAIELWDLVPEAADLLGMDRLTLFERAADAAHLAADHERATAIVTAAAAYLGPEAGADRLALLDERFGHYLWAAGETDDALAAYERAVERMPTDPETAELARVLGAHAQVLMLTGRYRESRERAEQALGVARRVGARSAEGHILSTLGFDLAFLGEPSQGEQLLDQARAIAEALGNPDDVGRAYLNLAELLSGPLNCLARAADVAAAGVERVRRLGLERSYGVSLRAIAANTLFRLGRWGEADRLVEEALASDPSGGAAIDVYLARVKLAVGRGAFDDAARDLETAEALSCRASNPRYQAPLLTLKAGLALWEGRLDDARRAVTTGLEHVAATEDTWFVAPLVWHGLRVEAEQAERAWARRDEVGLEEARRRGEDLLSRVGALARQSDEAAPAVRQAVEAYVDLCEAEWSRVHGGSCAKSWADAASSWAELGQPYPTAYARWREAEALLNERSRSARAAEALQEAHRAATELGAEPFRSRVESLAARARIPLGGADEAQQEVPRTSPGPPGSAIEALTPRERDVLLLVAEGRTNRQIAAELYISEKTASVHVSHILAKLGVRSRVQASTMAYELGLAPRRPPRNDSSEPPTGEA